MKDPFVNIDFGPCCACGETGPTVQNVILLPFRGSQPGTGWGCAWCDLPPDGAMAVVCDRCRNSHAPLQFAIDGWAPYKGRIPIDRLTEPYKHNYKLHPKEERPQRRQKRTQHG